MANARIFVTKCEDMTRSVNDVTMTFECFVVVTGEQIIQKHSIPVTVTFNAATFKTQIRSGLTQWVLDHLGETVVNIILPDLVPL